MPKPFWSGDESRRIIERIVVEGDLVLQTPAHFGNGDTDDLTDMPLLVDSFDGKTPLLIGASIAGALRSYLREREQGYGQAADRSSASVLLFGSLKSDDEGEQSPLIVDDVLGKNFGIEMRDGVRIKPDSRTAEEDKLFNLQLWQAGTTFPLRFELLLCERDDDKDYADKLKRALATVLAAFNEGSVTLGARKRRGYGRASVAAWRVKSYDLTKPDGLLDWVAHGDDPLDNVSPTSDVRNALGVTTLVDDHRVFFRVHATFSLDGSLLIRSGSGQDDQGPDMVHLHARQAGGSKEPILSGTSLGGALRARAQKIVNTIGTPLQTDKLIGEMFGPEIIGSVQPRASRVSDRETVVQNARADLVQNRVSIDRFTGGARDTALFNEQPTFGDDNTTVTVDVQLVNPKVYEIGLLLLLLKDLWTGDLPLGGESSIGRGRLKGRRADLIYRHDGTLEQWIITTTEKGLHIDGDEGHDVLEAYVTALNTHVKEETA